MPPGVNSRKALSNNFVCPDYRGSQKDRDTTVIVVMSDSSDVFLARARKTRRKSRCTTLFRCMEAEDVRQQSNPLPTRPEAGPSPGC